MHGANSDSELTILKHCQGQNRNLQEESESQKNDQVNLSNVFHSIILFFFFSLLPTDKGSYENVGALWLLCIPT